MAKRPRKPKKSHGTVMSKTGAYAIAKAAGIDRRGGAIPDAKKKRDRNACRTKPRRDEW